MSKIIYACLRHGSDREIRELERKIAIGAERLSPKCAAIRPTRVASEGRIVVGMFNPDTSSICEPRFVGVGYTSIDCDLRQLGGGPPEQASAICRSDGQVIEILSDSVGSRALWYYMDDAIFIASTSQRWIATVIGGFHPTQAAIIWMLVTGTLGPTNAWDQRLERLQANSSLRVDIESWSAKFDCQQQSFEVADREESAHKAALRESLEKAFASFSFDHRKWVLPLSGGYDSRAILCLLQNTNGLRALTWGTAASLRISGSDADIAVRLARSMGIHHDFFETDPARGSLPDLFEKFVAFGEGRTANVAGYLDGFAIWKTLLDMGVEGIIRGDEGFGWKEVRSAWEARRSVGLRLWEDYDELPERKAFDLPEQEIPGFLLQRNGETDSQWRDRLYHNYRIPTLLSALTDVKATFVEVANPLLTRSIISVIRSMPDTLRTEKRLFKKIVKDLSPAVPYAKTRAIVHQHQFLRSGEARDVLSDVLTSGSARSILSSSLLNFINSRLDQATSSGPPQHRSGNGTRVRRIAARILLSRAGKAAQKPKVDFHEMAFRVYIICKSHEILREDAAASRAHNQP